MTLLLVQTVAIYLTINVDCRIVDKANMRFRFFLMGILAINNFILMAASISMSIVK